MDTNINDLTVRIQELEKENARLKLLLLKHGIPNEAEEHNYIQVSKPDIDTSVRKQLSLQEKVELFHNLFKGREDIFAKRWYSNTTKQSGYQPVCEHEWNRDFCDKQKYKCTECLRIPVIPVHPFR